jgi:glycosyltransferase involved in cell wall biosynthesis
MRIGFFTPNYPGISGEGGIGSYTRTIGRGLADRGHEVHVLTPGRCESKTDGPIHLHGVAMDRLPGLDRLAPGAGACLRVALAANRLARRRRVDVFEFPNWEGYGALYVAAARTPSVVRLHTSTQEAISIDGVSPTRWDRWDVRRENWMSRRARLVVTHSAAHRKRMAEEMDLAADSIRLIPHGVEVFPSFVRPARPPGPPRIVYLGRLEHRKGTVELLQSVPKVLERNPTATFTLVGADRAHAPGGRTHAKFLEEEFPAHVRRAVTLAGRLPQAEVDQLIQHADLFVAPSRYESFGLIFLEAMRWGAPVVGTTAGGIPEVVEHGVSGWLVPPESPNELAEAMILLLNDVGLRQSLGAAGRRRAEAEFSVERMAQRVEGLYLEAMHAR